MKRTMSFLLGTVLAFFLFAFTLEGVGYVLLKTGYRRLQVPPTGAPVDSIRRNLLSSRVDDWLVLHRQKLDPGIRIDSELRHDPPMYTDVGIHHKRSLWGLDQQLAPEIDDEFQLVGKNTGKVKWQVRYQTDQYGHRKTHHERKPHTKRNLVFLGCSFTFGEGVQDKETFPAKVAEYLPYSQTYNFGIQGSSPARILKQLLTQKEKYLAAIDHHPGAVVLTFIDDHVRRIVGSSQRLIQHPSILSSDPRFFLEDGKLNYQSSFAEDSIDRFRFYRFFGTTHFAQAFNLEVPFIADDHLLLVSKVISEIRNEIQKHRPDLKFYLAYYPSERFYRNGLFSHLRQENIDILDYSDVFLRNVLGNQSDLGTDRHPSQLAHDLYAYLIARDLEERF